MQPQAERHAILERLDAGEITVEQALEQLQALSAQQSLPENALRTRWRYWRWLPLAGGAGLTGVSVLGMVSGGWLGWVCLAPWLFPGVVLLAIGAAGARSPWLHLRVQQPPGEFPRKIVISLPLPIRPLAWVLRRFGRWIPLRDATVLDELLLALEQAARAGEPLFVEVDEGNDAEKVTVYLG